MKKIDSMILKNIKRTIKARGSFQVTQDERIAKSSIVIIVQSQKDISKETINMPAKAENEKKKVFMLTAVINMIGVKNIDIEIIMVKGEADLSHDNMPL